MQYSAEAIQFDAPGQQRIATGASYGILLVLRGVARISNRWSVGVNDMLICKP